MPTEANSINAATTGIVGNTGTSFTGTAVTAHNVIVGGSTSSTLTNVAPSATSGVPVISQGAAADPTFGTAVVAGGGTGATSFTTNGAVISNTTSTGALAAVALSSQKFLVGNSGAPTAKALSLNIQTFTSTGTYTPTSGMVYCIIEAAGAGGGGGNATNGGNTFCAGTGGGGGEYAAGVFSSATIGASQSVTIGSGGTATNAGGNTSVGALISANGGGAGVSGTPQTATTNGQTPVAGGSGGSGGSVRINGGAAGGGWVTPGGSMAIAGDGGTSRFSEGVKGISILNGTVAQTTNGTAGTGFGGGGSGGLSFGVGSGTATGGSGSGGYVVVTEVIIS